MYLRGPKETVTHNRRIEHGNRENIGKIHKRISVLNFDFNCLSTKYLSIYLME